MVAVERAKASIVVAGGRDGQLTIELAAEVPDSERAEERVGELFETLSEHGAVIAQIMRGEPSPLHPQLVSEDYHEWFGDAAAPRALTVEDEDDDGELLREVPLRLLVLANERVVYDEHLGAKAGSAEVAHGVWALADAVMPEPDFEELLQRAAYAEPVTIVETKGLEALHEREAGARRRAENAERLLTAIGKNEAAMRVLDTGYAPGESGGALGTRLRDLVGSPLESFPPPRREKPMGDERSPMTCWNGEPCRARKVWITVGEWDESDPPAAWWRDLEGMRRMAVEVTYNDQTWYIDDQGYEPDATHVEAPNKVGVAAVGMPPGTGWAKVTEGQGSPRWPHADVKAEPGSVAPRGIDTLKLEQK